MTDIADIDVRGVMGMIPHRYPMLLVDRVEAIDTGKSIHAVKAVTINEQFFQGHFPDRPIMPGVLIIEALAQAAAILVVHSSNVEDKLVYFMSIDEAKFRKPVEPGVLLDLKVELIQQRGRVCKCSGKAYIGDVMATEATFTAMIADKPAS